MAIFTVVIAGATVVNVWVVNKQLGEMHTGGIDTHNLAIATGNLSGAYQKQADETAKIRQATSDFSAAMKRQADNTGILLSYAGQSAGAAASSAKSAQGQLTQMRAEQRAFIVVKGLILSKPDDKGGSIVTVQPIIENAGNTPTRNLSYVGPWVGFIKHPYTDSRYPGINLPDTPGDPAVVFRSAKRLGGPVTIIAPHTPLIFGQPPQHVSNEMFERLKKTGIIKGDTYVYGAIRYNDIFPSTPLHITKYCYIISWDYSRYTSCRHWDCADEECDADASLYNQELQTAFAAAGKSVPKSLLIPLGEKQITQ